VGLLVRQPPKVPDEGQVCVVWVGSDGGTGEEDEEQAGRSLAALSRINRTASRRCSSISFIVPAGLPNEHELTKPKVLVL
jgi:hypothetical protein